MHPVIPNLHDFTYKLLIPDKPGKGGGEGA
jgi:hypothetical protein